MPDYLCCVLGPRPHHLLIVSRDIFTARDMTARRLFWMKVLLGLLAIAGAYVFDWLAFSVWMTAYIPPDKPEVAAWVTRVYTLFATLLAIGGVWIALAVRIIREGRRMRPAEHPDEQAADS
ncbi:MAG: hypothetical protein P8174_11305 [Gemmatimonadota bacterium]